MDTVSEIDVARLNQQFIYQAVMRTITSISPDPGGSGGGTLELWSTIDGLVMTIAALASQSGQVDTAKKQRQLGDHVRDALLKNIKEVQANPQGLWSVEQLGGLN